jgi:hypothetical protein
MGKDPVGAGTFFPSPMLVYYIPPCRKPFFSGNLRRFTLGAFSFPKLQFSRGELHFE